MFSPDLVSADRYIATLLGLATGDALGTTLEFNPPGTFEPIDDLVGGGPFGLAAGEWTDDTSMALCLADSLVACRGFDAADQMRRYCRWYREGYLSSNGRCFDIGITVRGALQRFERSDDPFSGSTDPMSAGNGSLMRLAPIPLAYARMPDLAIEHAGRMSATTHAAREAVDACRYFAGLLCLALGGASKADLCRPLAHPTRGTWQAGELAPAIEAVAAGSFKGRHPPDIRGTGYVVDSLEAALWAFWHTDSFRAGALAAANLGEDADTTAAIFGQLAGAHYGLGGIPPDWLECLALREEIADFADQLYRLADVVAEGAP